MPKRERDETLTCKDCATTFVFTASEQATFAAKGFGARVRCAECTRSKHERYAGAKDAVKERPNYDTATEARLDAWIAAKRSKMFDKADVLRAALRKDGIDPDAARPIGFDTAAAERERHKSAAGLGKKASVKCFNCGAKGHRASECTKMASGSTACYHCGSEQHQGKDCPDAPEKTVFDPKLARCFGCGGWGHVAAACPKPSSRMACHVCGEEGHKARYCPNARDAKKALPAGVEAADVEAKLAAWTAARGVKDYETADKLRAELLAVGVNPNKPKK